MKINKYIILCDWTNFSVSYVWKMQVKMKFYGSWKLLMSLKKCQDTRNILNEKLVSLNNSMEKNLSVNIFVSSNKSFDFIKIQGKNRNSTKNCSKILQIVEFQYSSCELFNQG